MKVLGGGGQTLYVWRNIQLVKGMVILFFTLFILALILFSFNFFIYSSVGLFIIPLAYILGVYSYRSYLIWWSGSRGEIQLNEVLRGLDDSYLMINGVVLAQNRGDLDYVVVGPNGIFVIEGKNYGGHISCVGDSWSKVRFTGSGGQRQVFIGSPSNQVKRNAKVLKDFLLEHQFEVFSDGAPHIWVHAILVFTNQRASLELESPTVDVVEIDDLCSHIMSLTSEFTLTPEQVRLFGETILKHSR